MKNADEIQAEMQDTMNKVYSAQLHQITKRREAEMLNAQMAAAQNTQLNQAMMPGMLNQAAQANSAWNAQAAAGQQAQNVQRTAPLAVKDLSDDILDMVFPCSE